MHPDTAHTGGPNYSHEIRKMVYFRLKIMCYDNKEKNNKKIENKNIFHDNFYDTRSLKIQNVLFSEYHEKINETIENREIKEKTIIKEKKKKYKGGENILLESSHQFLFQSWEDVTAAHSIDMWADLQGVKALVMDGGKSPGDGRG